MATINDASPKETKEQKFTRLAESRVNTILERLTILGQLSDKKNYEYTDAQVSKIFRAIESEVKATKSKFRNHSKSRKRFTL